MQYNKYTGDLHLFFSMLKKTNNIENAYKKVEESLSKKQDEMLSRNYELSDEEYERFYGELVKLNSKYRKIANLNNHKNKNSI